MNLWWLKDWNKLVCKQEDTQWGGLKAGQVMADAQPIFQKLEDPNAPEVQPGPVKTGGKKKEGKVKQKAASPVVNASAS